MSISNIEISRNKDCFSSSVCNPKSDTKIAVIGAGIIGMTTACHFLKNGYRNVTVFSKDLPLQTNSDVAAALWRPLDAHPIEKAIEWSDKSYTEFFEVLYNYEKEKIGENNPLNPGISFQIDVEYFGANEKEKPEWMKHADRLFDEIVVKLRDDAKNAGAITKQAATKLLQNLTDMEKKLKQRLKDVPRHQNRPNIFASIVPLIDSTLYRKWQFSQFEKMSKQNVVIQTVNIENLEKDYDVVLNCAGEQARNLSSKADTYPIRGVVAVIKIPEKLDYCCAVEPNPELDDGQIFLNFAIIRPRENGGDCVVGAVYEKTEDSIPQRPEKCEEDAKKLLQRIVPLIPGIKSEKDLEILSVKEGFRSGAHEMYCDLQPHQLTNRTVLEGGAFGQGGGGYTTSCGIAQDLVKKCDDLINQFFF